MKDAMTMKMQLAMQLLKKAVKLPAAIALR